MSKTQLWLIAILLAFVLLLVFIWLWYDLELTRIDNQLKTSKPVSITNGKPLINQINANVTIETVDNPAYKIAG